MDARGLGSPPRVRSRHADSVEHHGRFGITSACAEQTPAIAGTLATLADHLRVCGADWYRGASKSSMLGSPPRVRSRQLYFTVF